MRSKRAGLESKPFAVQCKLPDQFQAELNGTVGSAAENRVRGGLIGSIATATELRGGGGIVEPSPGRAAWVGERWVIENVEEFRAELGTEALAELPVFRDREVPVLITRVAENIPAGGAQRPGG